MRSHVLVSCLLVSSAMLAPVDARPRPPAPKIERMLPGNTSGAVFVNVKRLFALYGDLIAKSPGYDKVRAAVAKGCPDPARDIDAVGLVSNLESSSQSAIGVVLTGKIDMPRFLKFAEAEDGATWKPSSYRGITFHTATVEGQSVQVGQTAEKVSILSYDPSGAHAKSKEIVETLGGGAPSFGSVNQLTLPSGWLMNGSIQIPAELSAQAMALGPQFEAVTKVRFASASITADAKTKAGTLTLKLTCDGKPAAQALHDLLAGLAQALGGARRGTPTDLLEKVQLKLSGASISITLEVPRSELEKIVGGTTAD